MARSMKNPDLQLDIFAHFLMGEKPRQIAKRYQLTAKGVSNHVARAWSRLRGQLVAQEVAGD